MIVPIPVKLTHNLTGCKGLGITLDHGVEVAETQLGFGGEFIVGEGV